MERRIQKMRSHRENEHVGPLDRRQLLKGATAAALVAALHPEPARGESRAAASKPKVEPLIRDLRLLTAAPLADMKAFYHDRLGFPVLASSETELTVGGGATPITFVRASPRIGDPWYHVAFNIPENKLLLARE